MLLLSIIYTCTFQIDITCRCASKYTFNILVERYGVTEILVGESRPLSLGTVVLWDSHS
jgi:hypothetical protein